MFKKLRNKLKDALASLSQKTEEEAEIIDTPLEEKAISKEKKEAPEKIVEEESVSQSEKIDELTEHLNEDKVIDKVESGTTDEVKKEIRDDKVSLISLAESEEVAAVVEEIKPKKKFKLFKRKEKNEIVPQPTKEVEDEKKEEPKKGLSKLTEKLTTKKISAEKFDNLFWDLEMVLLENNVSVQVIEKIKDDLKEELVDKPLPRNVSAKILEVLKLSLDTILTFPPVDLVAQAQEKKPLVIAVFGINGAGKTTSIAKLTKYFQNAGLSVVIAACDTFRAAAIQQIQEHADKLQVKLIKHDYGADAAAVAFDAVKYAEKNSVDIVLIDTAGRLHSNTNLMAELEKILRVAKPDVKLFVGESITGNDCIEQAQKFNALVQMDGAVLTKADVDEKGGAPLSISYVIKKPILFLGVGQNYEDLEPFDKEKVLERLGL